MNKAIFACAAAALLFVSAASAHDLSARIKALNGDDMPNCDEGHPNCGQFLTLAEAAIYALLHAPDGAYGRPGMPANVDDKMRRFLLAAKIQKEAHVILTADEVTLIEGCVAATFNPLVVGRINQAIDPGQAAKK